MLQRFWERRKDEEGFTLIELMVVVLIIGILIAIALPTFLGARSRAQDKAAQSSLRNALAAAKVIFTDTDDYSGVTATSMHDAEPSLTYSAGGNSTGPTNISFDVGDTTSPVVTNGAVELAAEADNGNCFVLADQSNAGTTFGTGTSGSCAASAVAPYPTGTSW